MYSKVSGWLFSIANRWFISCEHAICNMYFDYNDNLPMWF